MIFSSTIFLFLFLPAVMIGYYNPFWKSMRFRNAFLLLASLAFYAWGTFRYTLLLLLSIAVAHFSARKIEHFREHIIRKRVYLVLALFYLIGVLVFFKYSAFIVNSFTAVFHIDYTMMETGIPIGISFYTFQALSYILDVYSGREKAQKRVVNTALYLSLFPQLVAGPIVRYHDIAPELKDRHSSWTDIAEGVHIFLIGLFKKIFLANHLAPLADSAFAQSGNLSVGMAWLGAIAFMLQIYFDFSGYSNMAIGLGRMFGFHFRENFNSPYSAVSLTDFWRRWHISLSSWFRDYVYIPLGGNLVSQARWIRNMLIVWLLTGIWHGANWTFILWGLLYCIFLILEKKFFHSDEKKQHLTLRHGYTLLVVCLMWVLFRAENLSSAGIYLGEMFGIGANGLFDGILGMSLSNNLIYIILGVICCIPLKTVLSRFAMPKIIRKFYAPAYITIMVLLLFLAYIDLMNANYVPFVYFSF